MEGDRQAKVVVVTGASAGVGRATAREFAKHGARIGLLGRNNESLEAARREVQELGGEALAIPTDVARHDEVEAAAEKVEREFGAIDIWVNNAMTTVFAPFVEVTPEEYQRATEVTYLGYVWGTMSALRRMKPRDRGVIVQVGSALAYRGIPLQAPYCGAKFAIRGFTDSIRCELQHDGSNVHLTMVQLPAVNTPQFNWCKSKLPNHPQPVPPIFQPEVPARAIYWAAHQRRREVFVGMPTYRAIWGNKLFPWLGDWYLGKTGYQSQQMDQPVPSDRPSNLFEPVPGEHAAHGIFDERATNCSWALWATMNRGLVLAGAAALAGMALSGFVSRRLA